MKTAEVVYLGDLRTEATHLRSGEKIRTVAPPDNQGKGDAFSPTDLAATSLASCMMTIVAIAAESHGIDVSGMRAEVLKHMANDPRRIGGIEIDLYLPAMHYTGRERAILTGAANACPVGRSLHPALEQTLRIHWGDDRAAHVESGH
ncbi:MAG: OsmC family protein [Saprospiraceae bacterium]|nr:OsmC family protein [Saprospiraceae bacterium]